MASFKVKLFINEEERNVLNIDQSFRQVADITGKPEGQPYGEPLFLTLESTISDSFFYHHAFANTSTISGEIVFYKRDGFSVLHKLEFANAHILGLSEEFDAYSGDPLHFHLKIGWGIIRLNGIVFEEDWNFENPWENNVEPTVIEESEPQLLSTYYADATGNRIPENRLKRGQTIYFVIESANATGKELAIDLDNNKLDFIYNDEVLEEDILHVNINADIMRLELKTIAEQEQH